ncbi:FAD-binding oxidoreductase [Aureimonas altamirensis]|uniref:FAD-dependent oxidoreductase n=1 Tax=Aureimonas altamirensis TaxID=370622 RepID=UPI00203757E7|nr:FAD-dependent oxidoreductase [Aureimonas altamirensis]MCM2505987.1 FAD-binding oxidoreductase [Aureimonas altamirensis]
MEIVNTPSFSVYDAIIIGAGFYGCALAVHLAEAGCRVLVCDAGQAPFERASAVNQARVHTGFHYPRSFSTALRSRHNFERFADEFAPAIRRDFRMLYAIARYRSKVNARRFEGMFNSMQAPFERASPIERALFSSDFIEEVFACTEYAFDYTILRDILFERLRKLPVELCLRTQAERLEPFGSAIELKFRSGRTASAPRVFNITYSQINHVLRASGIAPIRLKHELVEIALIDPPRTIDGIAATVMDGPFFSTMPYPSAKAYSLTHVRYTPHFAWTDRATGPSAYAIGEQLPRRTRWRHMINDSSRYMPTLKDATWRRSLFEIKTVPVRNEHDDGRPILLQNHKEVPGLWSVLGSKIDNIYDLFEAVG